MEVKIMLWYAFKLFYIYFKSSWGPLVEKWLIVMSVMSLVDCNILPWWVISCWNGDTPAGKAKVAAVAAAL